MPRIFWYRYPAAQNRIHNLGSANWDIAAPPPMPNQRILLHDKTATYDVDDNLSISVVYIPFDIMVATTIAAVTVFAIGIAVGFVAHAYFFG